MARSHPAVGIDLGTTQSAVALIDERGCLETVRNDHGGLTIPSVVFFGRSGPLVGTEAWESGRDEPERMVQWAKRRMSRSGFPDPTSQISLPVEVVQAVLLSKLKRNAQSIVEQIHTAAITVPDSFDEPARKATQDAGRMAGLVDPHIINETMAAALYFGWKHGLIDVEANEQPPQQRVLVFHLGGGAFDTAVIEIQGRHYRTLASAGDSQLGGLDFDRRIVDHIAKNWIAQHGDDPRHDAIAFQNLFRKAAQAKQALSQRASVEIPFSHRGHRIRPELTRAQLEELTREWVERTMKVVHDTLDEALIEWSDLSRLILVGGSTRMPMIAQALSDRAKVGIEPLVLPDEAVVHGATVYAAILNKIHPFDGVTIQNVNAHDLGVLAKDAKTGQPRRQVIIARNTSLPTSRSIRFRTHEASQANVKIELIEGGDDQGKHATPVGKGIVDNLPDHLPQGSLIDVRFDYSEEGRLQLSAKLPSVKQVIPVSIQRCGEVSDADMDEWKERIASGRIDPGVSASPQSTGKEPGSTPSPSVASSLSSGSLSSRPTRRPSAGRSHWVVRRKLQSSERLTTPTALTNQNIAKCKSIKKLTRKSIAPTIDAPGQGWKSRRERLGNSEHDDA
jgi:molecular chaperone DnaK